MLYELKGKEYIQEKLNDLIQEVDDALVGKENDEWTLKNTLKHVASSKQKYEEEMKRLQDFTKEHKIKIHEKYRIK